MKHRPLLQLIRRCPRAPGVYRLYHGKRMVHIGMAAGSATLRSEMVAHARGAYGAATQAADHADWEVAPDALFAYRRFLSLFARATYDASGTGAQDRGPLSASKRHSRSLLHARETIADAAYVAD